MVGEAIIRYYTFAPCLVGTFTWDEVKQLHSKLVRMLNGLGNTVPIEQIIKTWPMDRLLSQYLKFQAQIYTKWPVKDLIVERPLRNLEDVTGNGKGQGRALRTYTDGQYTMNMLAI